MKNKQDRIFIVTLCMLAHAAGGALNARGQAPAVAPASSVAIENTNAAFTSSDVEVPQANAARPTVTIPARIVPTGYLQFEQGFTRAANSPGGTAGQTSLTETIKIALTTRLMLHFITEPYAYSTVPGPGGATAHSNDPGDLLLGAQVIALKAVGALPAAAVGYFRRVRSGTSANLDLGDSSQSALLLLGGDLRGGFHYDGNILSNEQNNGPVRRLQIGQTLALSHGLFPITTKQRLGSIVELSHFTQPFVTSTSADLPVARANTLDLLLVATYTPRPNIILDASVDRGLTSTSTGWQGSFGFTYLLPHRLWWDAHPVPMAVGRRTSPRTP